MIPASLPKHASSIADILPPLPLLAIFYWGIARPDRLGFITVFIAGLMQDALMATPFGSSALLWVIFRYAVLVQRKDLLDQGFVAQWAFFAALLFGLSLLQWIVIGYYIGRAIPVSPALMQCVLGILLFPAMHTVLYTLEHRFYRRYWYVLQAA